jgi:type IV secretory pathway ATPase VirB11/archaellum biosynthesis ATPase
MSLPSKSLRPLAPSIRYNIRSLATARPVIPDFDDEPGLPELEIPSPNVYPNNGSNVLEVKSNLPYHTLAHTLAIARAVEAKCGRVINIDQYRVSLT